MMHGALLAITVAAQSSNYAVDGLHLGENISSVISKRGKPEQSNGVAFTWFDKGAKLTLLTKGDGTIVAIDIIAGPGDKREIQVPGQAVAFTETGHVNYVPPAGARFDDFCGAGLLGSPCEAIRLDTGVELVMNFGMENGSADWGLSEVILAERNLLINSGRVIGQ